MGNTMAMQLCSGSGPPIASNESWGLKGTGGPFLRVTGCLGVGLDTLSARGCILGVVHEPIGVLDVFTTCSTSEMVGHVPRSLKLARS